MVNNVSLLAYVPATIVLVGILILVTLVVRNVKPLQESGFLTSSTLPVMVAGALFALLLVVQLFRDQPWIADILKVLTGAFIGAAAAKAATTAEKDREIAITQSGVGNKAAGRDLIETVQELKGNIEHLNDAVINLSERSAAGAQPTIRRNDYIRATTTNPMILAQLEVVRNSAGNDWTRSWIDLCLSQPEFLDQIRAKADELRKKGWRVTELTFDNIAEGLHVNFTIERTVDV